MSIRNALLSCLSGSLIIFSAASVEAASSSEQASEKNSYASIAELPALAGLWEISRGGAFNTNTQPRLTPPYAAMAGEYAAAQARGEIQDSPAANCVPPGMPINMREPYPMELLFNPGKITIILEAYSQWRQIFTDGRGHPEDPDLTFNGHSIGHWEGDTLVVDTVGFTRATAMARSFGVRHSEQMRIVERMRLQEPDLLVIETTVHDPEALIEPWVSSVAYNRHADWNLAEYVCQQNNRNFTTEDGKAGINLEYTAD
ncbi:MAG: hypothetical protein RQ899_02310 [Pseudomonadales bacterium]|nr:hypothetical protein [Pseudomonadales bacterium]